MNADRLDVDAPSHDPPEPGAHASCRHLRRQCACEMFGTFAVVFAGTGAIVIDDVSGGAVTHVGVALTFGLIVMAMIYSIGDVSGAHLNPAVTLGFWAAGRLRGERVGPYVVSQFIGAMIASGLIRALFGNQHNLGATRPAGPEFQSFVLEVLLTALLMFVILSVSNGPRETGVMAGIAVGGIVGLEALFAGPISGASMNPARSLAPAIVSGQMADMWIYLIAPTAGAVLAVPCWRLTRAPERDGSVVGA